MPSELAIIAVWLLVLSIVILILGLIEARVLVTNTHTIAGKIDAKMIVISDLHLGVFKRAAWLRRIVKKIKSLHSVDAVFILGDWLYKAKTEEISSLLMPLAQIQAPIYAVLGNHDYDTPRGEHRPGGNLIELAKVLHDLGITMLDNSEAILRLKKKTIHIVGLGDEEHNPALSERKSSVSDFSICIMHNPDSIHRLAAGESYDLLFAGHTHNGQINIPALYRIWIPLISDYVGGWYPTDHGKLLVSNGVGEAALPIRLLSVPTIEIVEIQKGL